MNKLHTCKSSIFNYQLSITSFRHGFKESGFSYVEVLIAVVMIVICLVPIMDSFRTGATGVSINEDFSIDHYALQSKMEEVLKEPFANLDAAAFAVAGPTIPTSYSDSYTTTDNRQINRNVYIWPYDGDNADLDNDPFTGTDTGLLYVKVELYGTSSFLETLVN